MLFMPFPVDTCVDYRGCKSPAVWLRKKKEFAQRLKTY